jgi:pyridoxamine 5'-phosphate oxidase
VAFDFSLDPLVNFENELKIAVGKGIPEPTAMSLSTISKIGDPEVRIVLFKGMIRGGLSFYTNYNSPKSQALDQSGKAAIVFFWQPLSEQIRMSGPVDRLTRAESEAYFRTRARLSQIGAWASDQSSEIPNFEFLNQKAAELEKKFAGKEIPCPPHWGGFRLLPLEIEFWFGREGRMHERYFYSRSDTASRDWNRSLKSP